MRDRGDGNKKARAADAPKARLEAARIKSAVERAMILRDIVMFYLLVLLRLCTICCRKIPYNCVLPGSFMRSTDATHR